MKKPAGFSLEKTSLKALAEALDLLEQGYAGLPASPESTGDFAAVLQETARRMQDNYPYFHPLYAGQMLKPPHPVARAAYALAMWINPNNHALDGGRASSQMEKEAVAELASMFGWREHLGHLCGGGTMANLEALWVASEERPSQVILASEQAHYTHRRISSVLGIPFEAVPCDSRGRMDVAALSKRLAKGDVGTIVATLGTTAIGAVDPLPQLLDLQEQFNYRIHADAAYGGYFGLAGNLGAAARTAFERLGEVDSIVIDPHKHGLQPYGCGCVLFRDPGAGKHYQHDSPYTYFSSDEMHLGEISLECSRPGASAVALWATQRLLPLVRDGEFSRTLERSREAALGLHERLAADERFLVGPAPELDIVVWLARAPSVSEASDRSRAIFVEAARHDLHLAVAEIPTRFFDLVGTGIAEEKDTVSCLRSVLMKPNHLNWLDEIYTRLGTACDHVLGND